MVIFLPVCGDESRMYVCVRAQTCTKVCRNETELGTGWMFECQKYRVKRGKRRQQEDGMGWRKKKRHFGGAFFIIVVERGRAVPVWGRAFETSPWTNEGQLV